MVVLSRRVRMGLASFALVGLILGSTPIALGADPPTPVPTVATTVTVTASASPVTFGSSVTLTATVSPAPGGGTIAWSDANDRDEVLPLTAVEPASGSSTLNYAATRQGTHALVASFGGSPGFGPSSSIALLVAVVEPGAPTTTLIAASTDSIEEHAQLGLTVTVSPPFAGTVFFVDGAKYLGAAQTDPVTGTGTTTVALRGVGGHQISAVTLGDGMNGGSLSAPLFVQATPDVTVFASGQTVSPSAFYPVKDGYRDTTAIRGRLDEPASVAISIYNPAGKKIKTASLGERTGVYSVAWNGRSSGGTLQPAGRYKVVQVVTDLAGGKRTVASFVTISSKKLVWKTASQTKFGEAFSYWNASPYADVSTTFSQYSRGVQLFGNLYDEFAWVEYDFRLPSAVEYGKLTWTVTGAMHRPTVTGGPAWLSLWNYKANDDTLFAQTGLAYGTYSISTAGTDFVKSRKVEAFVSVYGDENGHWDVEKVKLTYRYAVLQ